LLDADNAGSTGCVVIVR
jgi:protein phosphatase PTC1